jgi:hypothetical protein
MAIKGWTRNRYYQREAKMKCTPSRQAIEEVGERVAERVKQITHKLGEEVGKEGRTLAWFEEQVMRGLKESGQMLLAGLCELSVERYAATEIKCACGKVATYQRKREGKTQTLFGEVVVKRAYYLCGDCRHGQHPLDQQWEFCAGGVSSGLYELMALMGAEFVFEEAASLLEKLTLVHVSPNRCRKAAETLGALVATDEEKSLFAAWDAKAPQVPALHEPIAGDLYISMDGVTVHIDGQGWKNQWLGVIYTTKASLSDKRPDVLEVRTQHASFYADLGDIKCFGDHRWVEAQRRGMAQAQRLIVLGDGAHWIWNLADEHFPAAIQILDWDHASAYVWQAAHALYGESTDLAKHWAKQHLDLLWEGQVATVIAHLQATSSQKAAVQEVLTYFRNHQQRMRYDLYRADGLQIGAGTIESGGKHVISARLKQAGMIWSPYGARSVAKLRTRLKSRRWPQTIALHAYSPRAYFRHAA